MKTDNVSQIRSERVWLSEGQCNLDDFKALVECTTDIAEYPLASEVVSPCASQCHHLGAARRSWPNGSRPW
jgi:hypothetical protein